MNRRESRFSSFLSALLPPRYPGVDPGRVLVRVPIPFRQAHWGDANMPAGMQELGILKPRGGGDPVPLRKDTLVVGRRSSCDIVLDFENVSGRHCELRFMSGVWHVRDLGSSNGTTVNGQKIASDQSVMPDIELGIAGHLYTIDYEPAGPALIQAGQPIIDDEEVVETRKKHSLMELAGLDTDDKPMRKARPTRPPAKIERLSAEDNEFDDTLPENFKPAAPKKEETNVKDEDFLKLFE